MTDKLGWMPDWRIRELSMPRVKPMIEPYADCLVQEDVISYGLSSLGYDVRLSDEGIVTVIDALNMQHRRIKIIDPKAFHPNMVDAVEKEEDGSVILPPHSFTLGSTVEYIRMPRHVVALCVGKSTYARCGLIVSMTPLEPGWEGNVTIEMTNATPVPIKIYPNEGICQFMFIECRRPETSYASRKGKYQGQKGTTLPKMKKE